MDSFIQIIDYKNAVILKNFKFSDFMPAIARFSPDGQKIITCGSGNKNIRIYDFSKLLKIEEKDRIPTQLICENYPNPFNSGTVIRYYLPLNDRIIIKVFNCLGEEIKTILDKEENAGEYKVTWQPDNLPSGVYYIKVQTSKSFNILKALYQK